jgi:excisionase family DNA binding protein
MVFIMYVTIPELAEYLSMNEAKVRSFVLQGRIRAIYDGEQYLINKNQFSTHFEQVEKYRLMIQEYLNEPIPEDIDVKDED